MLTPIHTGTLRGKPIRFFQSPVADPDLPWHSSEDLLRALDLPRDMRRRFNAGLVGRWRADTRTVDTEEGITTICPHFMAQGIIGSVINLGVATEALEREYVEAASQALGALLAHIPDPAERARRGLEAALRRFGSGEAA